MSLSGKRILLAISGGIAAYKAAELTRLLVKAGASVRVVMSEAARHFVGAPTFQALSGHTVYSDQWDARIANNMAHIELSRNADLILLAPASADCLAKIAHGLADDLLTTMILARDCPLLVAPAMNRQMWENPATKRNITQLTEDGVLVLGPDVGEQACGEYGEGRMLDPDAIVEELYAIVSKKILNGKKILITAGPTFEAIDRVRGITNLSSGKMGFALARATREAGAEVVLVAGPVSLPTPRKVRRIDVISAQQMFDVVLEQAATSDVFIAVAAVADYRVTNTVQHKIKKSGALPELKLELNPDILATVAALPTPPFCVGFAAESENLEQYATEKRVKKKIPFLVANLIQIGFGGNENQVTVIDDYGITSFPTANKLELARKLVVCIAQSAGFISNK